MAKKQTLPPATTTQPLITEDGELVLPRIRTQLNIAIFPVKRQVFTQVSLTIPDETKSIREIIRDHARGIPYDSFKRAMFLGDEEQFDPRRRDLVEIQKVREETAAVIRAYEDDVAYAKRLKAKKKLDDEIEAEVKKRLAAKEAARTVANAGAGQ